MHFEFFVGGSRSVPSHTREVETLASPSAFIKAQLNGVSNCVRAAVLDLPSRYAFLLVAAPSAEAEKESTSSPLNL
jgi:hypothetical protein